MKIEENSHSLITNFIEKWCKKDVILLAIFVIGLCSSAYIYFAKIQISADHVLLLVSLIFVPPIFWVNNWWERRNNYKKNKATQLGKEIEAQQHKVNNLLGLSGLRLNEHMEHKYPYPDQKIKGLGWTVRLKRHGAVTGKPFCLNCKIPIYDYFPSTDNTMPITVTVACTKCKNKYLIEDLEETVKSNSFDLLHDQNYLYKLINTDIVDRMQT